jgi:mRNA interferase RelE/StbE
MDIAFKKSFLKSIKKLKDKSLKDDIFDAINSAEDAETLDEIPNIKKLTGYSIYYRIRIGDYRIGLKWVDNEKRLYFVTFDHRKDVYKNFP